MRSVKTNFSKNLISALFFLCILFAGTLSFAATINVLVLYDTTAKAWVDWNGGMETFASTALGKANMALTLSGIENLSFNVVHVAAMPYTSSANGEKPLSDDLNALENATGGLATVPELRAKYRADLVTMLIDTGRDGGYTGRGGVLTDPDGDADTAYTVCSIQAVASRHTLTHEIGHNMGADHSIQQQVAPGPNSALGDYAAGWYITDTDNNENYHTIMAYSCDDEWDKDTGLCTGNSYISAPLFSSPSAFYNGGAAGDTIDGDNARVLQETMNVVAAYSAKVDPFISVVQSDLKIGSPGIVKITIEAPESDQYLMEVWDDDGYTGPEWMWEDQQSSVVSLIPMQNHTFEFTVTPDDEEEGFQFRLYQKTFTGLFKIVKYAEVTLSAELADTLPPTVHTLYGGTQPNTNIHMTFSENMDMDTLNDSNITVSGSSSGLHSWDLSSSSFNESSFELVIQPGSIFSYSETVTVTISTNVKDLAGNNKYSPTQFSFTIQDEPTVDPTSINADVNASDTSIDPGQAITISGTATYNTGAPVNGTATIFVGSAEYTTPVSSGSFTRIVPGPTASGNVIVNVTDGTLNKNVSINISVEQAVPDNTYDLTTHVVEDYNYLGPDDGVEWWEKDRYRTDDEKVYLLALFEDINIDHDLDLTWKFYNPDGSLYAEETLPNSILEDWNGGWGVRVLGYDIVNYSMSYKPGRYKVRFYVDGERKATHDYVVGWEFTEHRMCKDVDEANNHSCVAQTNTFTPDDIKAVAWHNFADRSQELSVKAEFYDPNGSLYSSPEYIFEDLPSDTYWEYSRSAHWIHIKGHNPEYMCGQWSVKFYAKNPTTAIWEHIYTDHFRIEEKVRPTVSDTGYSPSTPIEGQPLTLDVTASDNNHLQKIILHWNDGTDRSYTWDDINASSANKSRIIGSSFSGGQLITYWAEVWDESGNHTVGDTKSVTVLSETVSSPSRPTGPDFLKPNVRGTFVSGASSSNLGSSVEYQFDWGDGVISDWGSSSQNHSWNTKGNYAIKVRARSESNTEVISSWSSSLAIGINNPPTVEDVSKTIAGGGSIEISLSSDDADNDPLTFTILTNPSKGSLSGTLPSLVYTPNNDVAGLDTFTFLANDGLQDSNIGTVSIGIGDYIEPEISITSPTDSGAYVTKSSFIEVGGTAFDNMGITVVKWSNDIGGQGTCNGTSTWNCSRIDLLSGQNYIKVTALDAAGNEKFDTIDVTRETLLGDVTGNGYVDLEDLIVVLKILVGSEEESIWPAYSDVNGDSRLGAEEIIFILRDISGVNSKANVLFSENFSDSDYTSNPNWTPFHASIAPGQITIVDNAVRILRTGAGGSGQSERLELEVDIPINAQTTIAFDAKPVYRSVRSGCGDSCTEHPANVQLYLEDASGTEFIVRYAVNYNGAVQDVVNGNFRQYATSAVQNTWVTDLQYTISEAWPGIERITKIMLFGAGWDFEGYIDNIVISQPGTTVLYNEDFSSDPGFTSLSTEHAYWDSGQGNYFVNTRDNLAYKYWAYSPEFDEFDSSLGGTIELDILFEYQDWGTYPGVFFYMSPPNEINATDNPSVLRVGSLYTDQHYKKMYISDIVNPYLVTPTIKDDTWYHVSISANEESSAGITVTEKDTGFVVYEIAETPFEAGPFRYLGVGYYGNPDYGRLWAPIRIDNVEIRQ